ncbi:MAG: hypothetical protein ABSG25_07920 [Bryobacteraceae bacterium]
MTGPSKAIAGLQRFGYTERQAAFLQIVALHGGYFLRRQYEFFIGNEKGGSSQRFMEVLVQKGHATVLTFCDNTVVCHLAARAFYRVVGNEHSRNRRFHQPFTVKSKLMALDFILSRKDVQFIATERERVALFRETLRVPISALPAKSYQSKGGGTRTVRYFVDRNPVFISAAAEGAVPVVGFAYIDAGSDTTAGFRTYLAQYRRLFKALDNFLIVYVSSHSRLVPAASKDFRKALRSEAASSSGPQPETVRLLAHFEARLCHERRDYAGFDTAKLQRLSRELKELSGPRYDALFTLYRTEGTASVLRELGESAAIQAPEKGSFEGCVLGYSYAFLGDEWAA